MWNKSRTKVEFSKSVPKYMHHLKRRLTAEQKKRIAEDKRCSYRLVDYILNKKRKDTIGVFDAGVKILMEQFEGKK